MKLFAIRLSRDWVEFRSSAKPIKGFRSSIKKRLPVLSKKRVQNGWIVPPRHHFYPDGVPRLIDQEVQTTKNVTLTQVNWRGGRKLGIFRTQTVMGQCQMPPLNGAITIKTLSIHVFLEKLRKREHKAPPQRHY